MITWFLSYDDCKNVEIASDLIIAEKEQLIEITSYTILQSKFQDVSVNQCRDILDFSCKW